MTTAGELTGTVSVRPVRVALAMDPVPPSLDTAIDLATTAWGGVYSIILDSTNSDRALRLAEGCSVDVIVAVDDGQGAALLSNADGFKWTGGGEFGPFGKDDVYGTRLRSPEWLMRQTEGRVLQAWDPADILAPVLRLWHGSYGESEVGARLANSYTNGAAHVAIDDGAEVDFSSNLISPIDLTSQGINYTGEPAGPAIVVLRSGHDVPQLINLWNERATGARIYPWVIGCESRITNGLRRWISVLVDTHILADRVDAGGKRLGASIRICVAGISDPIPDALSQVLAELGVAGFAGTFSRPTGWYGHHPMQTRFENEFAVAMTKRNVFEVPIPRIEQARHGDWNYGGGVVAVQVGVSDADGLDPGWTVGMPAMRQLADVLLPAPGYEDRRFCRPTYLGRTTGIQAGARVVLVEPVRSLRIFERLLQQATWKLRQTDSGMFSSRVISMLGGAASTAANQPAVRTVLGKSASTDRGLPIASLISSATASQGRWPGPFRVDPRYPTNTVYWLLSTKLLRYYLPVRCTACSTETVVRPDDLKSDMLCEFCGSAFPLGLALAKQRKAEWLIRASPNISAAKLSETLAVMAVLSLFSNVPNSNVFPHVLGVEIDRAGDPCEIDIAAFLSDSGVPLVVIAETKSYSDRLTEQDVANLKAVQAEFFRLGVECYVAFGTFRQSLDPDEVTAIRVLADPTVHTLSGSARPVLPIVLLEAELSSPPFDGQHPMGWLRGGDGLSAFAVEACKRNLGLVGWQHARGPGQAHFNYDWTTPPATEPS